MFFLKKHDAAERFVDISLRKHDAAERFVAPSLSKHDAVGRKVLRFAVMFRGPPDLRAA